MPALGIQILDLFLLWLCLYRLLVVWRDSRSLAILVGFGVLGGFFALGFLFELPAISGLAEFAYRNIFLVAIVLFQGEIRRAVAQLGSRPFVPREMALEESHLIDELAKGLVQLAQRGWGALVVIEREIALDYFIEVGTLVDGVVRSSLLNSIFLPLSPLHDGAVVIRKGRLFAAGCFLPLSKNPLLDRQLGTRHRAAIGLTEETDAVVFVVSEENSTVSVVEAGKLTADLDHARLREVLYRIYKIRIPRDRRERRERRKEGAEL